MKNRMGMMALLALLCALAMLGAALAQVLRAPALIEFSAVAPAEYQAALTDASEALAAEDEDEADITDPKQPRDPSQLKAALDRVKDAHDELMGVAPGYALWGIATDASVAEQDNEQNAVECALYAAGEGYFSLYPEVMWSGREITYDELRYGDRACMLDEQLALSLFGTTDAVDKTVRILGRNYRVCGVVRHGRTVGDPAASRAFVPLRVIAKDGAQLRTLTISAPPSVGAGALQAAGEVFSGLLPGGTMQDARREKQLALLVPTWTIGALGAYLLGLLMVRLFRLGGRWAAGFRADLRHQYALRLLPGAALKALAFLAALLLLSGAMILLAGQMVQPILRFPEWVPVVPVEPDEIQKTFWSLQWANNALVRCATPLTTRLKFFGSLANTGTILALLSLIAALMRRARR